MKVEKSWNNTVLDPNAIASPCGSIGILIYIKPIHSSMTLLSSITTPKIFQSTKMASLGKETKVAGSSEAQIVPIYSGSTLKTSIL